MNCAEWEEKIALYMGDDLAAGEVAAVVGHVGKCAGCARLFRELEADANGLRMAPPEASTLDYSASRQQIRRQLFRYQWRRRLVVPMIAVAAAVIVAIAIRTVDRNEAIPPPRPVLARIPQANVQPRISSPARTSSPYGRMHRRNRLRHLGGAGLQPARFRRKHTKPDRELEAALERFTTSDAPLQQARPKTPFEMQIRTKDPNVTIMVFQANEAIPNENE